MCVCGFMFELYRDVEPNMHGKQLVGSSVEAWVAMNSAA